MEDRWKDITADLRAALAALPPSTVIHGPEYSDLDAMSALEMGDVRMDPFMQGPIPPPETFVSPTVTPALSAELSRQFLSRLALYLQGIPLVYSLGTCYYVYDLDKCPDEGLRGLIAPIMHAAHIIKAMVSDGRVCEEDEFPLYSYCSASFPDATKYVETSPFLDLHIALEKKDVERAQLCLKSVLAELSAWESLGSASDLGSVDVSDVSVVFNNRLPARYVGSTPPRKIVIPSFSDAIATLRMYLNDVEAAVNMCHSFMQPRSSIPTIIVAIEGFNNSRKPGPVVRSFIAHFVIRDHSQRLVAHEVREFVRDRISAFTPEKANFGTVLKSPEAEIMVDRIAVAIVQWTQVSCMNRALLRRRCTRQLHAWGIIQEDAMVMDSMFLKSKKPVEKSHAFLYVCTDFALHIASVYLQMGFELELYQPSEIPAVLFYWDYLLNARIQFMGMVKTWKKHVDYTFPEQGRTVIVTHYLMRGLSRASIAAVMDGLISRPKVTLGSVESMFDHRFRALFHLAEPTPLRYKDWQRFVPEQPTEGDKVPSSAELRNSAVQHFVACKNEALPMVDWPLRESFIKVVDANRVATEFLNKTGLFKRVDVEFSDMRIPVLKPRKT